MDDEMAIRVFTGTVVKVQIREEIPAVDARIAEYLDSQKIPYKKEEHLALGFRYLLYRNNEGQSGYTVENLGGIIQIQPYGVDQLFLLVRRVFFPSDDEQEKYDRFFRLRSMIQPLFLRNNLPEAYSDKMVHYENGFDREPLTPEERARIDEQEAQHRESRRQQGFEKRILLDETFETDPQKSRRLIQQYINRQREFGKHFWMLIDPDSWNMNQDGWAKELFISEGRYFTDLGKITLIQLNDNLCRISIENTWDAIPVMAQAEADTLYFETRKELEALVIYIKDSFSDHDDVSPTNTGLPFETKNVFAPNMTDEQPIILDKEPWLIIPDLFVDRKIVQLWHEGLSNTAIGDRVGMQPKSVTNRLSELRIKFGEKIVPRRRKNR